MHAKSLLEGRNKIIDAFKDDIFAAYNFALKNVNRFIKGIKSTEEKINLGVFEDFFRFSSPADYAKQLTNTSRDENKKIVAEAKDILSNLEYRTEKMSDKEKKYKNANEAFEIIYKILDYNNDAQFFLSSCIKS